mmetsp:Transcript_7860/g.20165  ORF Transcript_7860/g.20165 Transcript_7860/m.20165 type:complete len:312 (+) Transcript_7860:1023-1958(+)
MSRHANRAKSGVHLVVISRAVAAAQTRLTHDTAPHVRWLTRARRACMSPTTARESRHRTQQRAKIVQCRAVPAESTSRMDALAQRTKIAPNAVLARLGAVLSASIVHSAMAKATQPLRVDSAPSDLVNPATTDRRVTVPGRRICSVSNAALQIVLLGSFDPHVTACFPLLTVSVRRVLRRHALWVRFGRCATGPTPGTPSANLAIQSVHWDTIPLSSAVTVDFGAKRSLPSALLGITFRVLGPWRTPLCVSHALCARQVNTASFSVTDLRNQMSLCALTAVLLVKRGSTSGLSVRGQAQMTESVWIARAVL